MQPNTTTVLQLDYIGMPNTYNGLVFWVSCLLRSF